MRQPFLVGYCLVGRRDMDDGCFGDECVIKDNGCVSRIGTRRIRAPELAY